MVFVVWVVHDCSVRMVMVVGLKLFPKFALSPYLSISICELYLSEDIEMRSR